MSKDNQGAIFIASFAEQLIREKVMMDEPNLHWGEEIEFIEEQKKYRDHVASRRTFPYDVKEEQDGKELREGIDFQIKDDHYQNGENVYGIKVAIPIEPEKKHTDWIGWEKPDTPLQPVKESAMGWLKKEGYPDVMPMTLDNLGIILDRYTKYLSSPPEPSSKEQEGYWKKRCEAAEEVIYLIDKADTYVRKKDQWILDEWVNLKNKNL